MAKHVNTYTPVTMGGRGLQALWQRLFFVFCAVVIYRAGCFIPVPGLNPEILAELIDQHRNTLVDLFNLFSGGAVKRASVLALGIGPYISASIIIRILAVGIPFLADLKKEGGEGRRKMEQYTRIGALFLAVIQAVGMAGMFTFWHPQLLLDTGWKFYSIAVLSLIVGSLLLMWIGEQITEKGIGNGASLIIFFGIVSELPASLSKLLEKVRVAELNPVFLALFIGFVILMTYGVVFIESAQRKIMVHYANRQVGPRMLALPTTHLPLKLNMSGVMPVVFAPMLIGFPSMLAQWFGHFPYCRWLLTVESLFKAGPLYLLAYAGAIFFCTFAYTDAIAFNPKETVDNLKKAGAFIPGIRPGEQTLRYIQTLTMRLTSLGALYLIAVCLAPNILECFGGARLSVAGKSNGTFNGTSLLIVVGVIMEFTAQIQTYLISKQYDSVIKKSNSKSFRV